MLTVAKMDSKSPNRSFQSDHAEACPDRHGSDETNHFWRRTTARGNESPQAVMISHSMDVGQALPSPLAIIVIMSRQRLA